MTRRIYIVDDHAITRKGYLFLIAPAAELEVCGEAGSAAEARAEIPAARPDLVIVDVTLEDESGIELVKDLAAMCPDVPALVVSMHDEALYAERALRAGARGYVMKHEVHAVGIEAIRTVLAGGLYLSDRMNRRMLLQYVNRNLDEASPLDRLSDRELETFEHIGRGRSTGQIAEAMHISPKTVGTYRRRIKEKLELDTGAELVQRAVQHVQRGSASSARSPAEDASQSV